MVSGMARIVTVAFAVSTSVRHDARPITTTASERTSGVHDRMPVILGPADYDRWFDPAIEQSETLLPLLTPCGDPDLVTTAISTRVNNARNEGPECIAPADATLF